MEISAEKIKLMTNNTNRMRDQLHERDQGNRTKAGNCKQNEHSLKC